MEAPDTARGPPQEIQLHPGQRLPEVKGTSNYKPLVDGTVRFALNVWAGWAPVIFANDGFKAGQGMEDARAARTSRSSWC